MHSLAISDLHARTYTHTTQVLCAVALELGVTDPISFLKSKRNYMDVMAADSRAKHLLEIKSAPFFRVAYTSEDESVDNDEDSPAHRSVAGPQSVETWVDLLRSLVDEPEVEEGELVDSEQEQALKESGSLDKRQLEILEKRGEAGEALFKETRKAEKKDDNSYMSESTSTGSSSEGNFLEARPAFFQGGHWTDGDNAMDSGYQNGGFE